MVGSSDCKLAVTMRTVRYLFGHLYKILCIVTKSHSFFFSMHMTALAFLEVSEILKHKTANIACLTGITKCAVSCNIKSIPNDKSDV